MPPEESKPTHKTNKMWGGRFTAGPSELMEQINASIDFDQRLYAQDIRASKAHVVMLARQEIVSQADADSICQGLDQIEAEIEAGEFDFNPALEDIHMNVESRLTEIVGEAAGRLHTGRSRNDQVVTDVRLWLRDRIDELDNNLLALLSALIDKAEHNADTAMPGFTHLQVAQPVSFGHHLLAYVEMLGRDLGRLRDCRARLNECPLGAAALAGTTFPIDRNWTAQALEFDRPTANSMDSVSSRDFITEFLFFASMCSVHLSRFAEELVNWNSDGFKFVDLSDAFTSGSSIMPQKKNPDAAELLRAKPGRIVGSLTTILIVLKGLPLAFMKDMQEDKEPLFDAADSIDLCVRVATGLVLDLEPIEDNMRGFLDKGFATATDLADWLVVNLSMPFRKAHHISAEIISFAAENSLTLHDVPLAEMQKIEAGINESIYAAFSNETSLNARTSFGGTAPSNVKIACTEARKRFLEGQA